MKFIFESGTTLLLLAVILSSATQISALIRSTPEGRCTEEAQRVCVSCKGVGECRSSENGFTVSESSICTTDYVCTEDLDIVDCYSLNPSVSPTCLCDEGKACALDPYDSKSYVNCSDPIEYGSCSPPYFFNEETCECENVCSECGSYFPGPEGGNCASYYDCANDAWTEMYCPEGSCFNTTSCSCELDCPPCGYAPDPEDSSGFILCSNGAHNPGQCYSGAVFDPESCKCVPPLEVTTEEIGTTTDGGDPCDYCGFFEYPGSCSNFYECLPDGSVAITTCPGDLCFNPVTCFCEN